MEYQEQIQKLRKELREYKKAEPKICPHCQKPMFGDDKYCPRCGIKQARIVGK